jgi:tetratricopeptide (TPR) repeat protein
MEFCLAERDHQILTNFGFLFLDEVEALVERRSDGGAVIDWRGLQVANYDPRTEQLRYETPRALVVRSAAQAADDGFVEFRAPRANISVVATAGHDMYFGEAPNKFAKVTAGAIADRVDASSAPLRTCVLTGARGGVDVSTLPATAPLAVAESASRAVGALLSDALPQLAVCAEYGGRMDVPFVQTLGAVVTRAQVTAALELYGCWLGSDEHTRDAGAALFVPRDASALQFVAERIALLGWARQTRLFESATGAEQLVLESAAFASLLASSSSCKRVAAWAWQLAPDAWRAVLRGAQMSASSSGDAVCTAHVALRDDLVRALLHCGFSAHFVAHGAVWRVLWSDALTPSLALATTKTARGSADEMTVQRMSDDDGDDVGRAWCFKMGGGFVVTRRAVRVTAAAYAELQATRRALAAQPSNAVALERRAAALREPASKFVPGTEWVVLEATCATIQGNCGRGSLSGVLDKEAKTEPPRGFRDESRIAAVAMGVLSGLLYMHRRNVVHRDIKSDNVLIGRDGMIKLADFGISRRITDADSRMGTMIGTPHYLAPEVVLAENEGGYTSKVDVWSLGVVCLELADGRPPFADLNPMKVLFELANNPVCKLRDATKWSQMFNSFTEFCCKAQPAQRPSSDHMIKHPFLNNATGILTFPDGSTSNGAAASGGGGGGGGAAAPSPGAAPSPVPPVKGVRKATAPGGAPAPMGGLTPQPKQSPNPPADANEMTMRKNAKRKAIQLFNRGIEFASGGQHDEAIAMYMQALELDSRHIGSLTNLGVAYINKKDYDSAIKQFLLVCEIRPTDANNFVNVGVAYANKKDYVEALKAFERALELDPNHLVAKQMQRRCQADQRKSDARQQQQSTASRAPSAAGFGGSINGAGALGGGGGGGGNVPMSAQYDPNRDQMPALLAACVQFLEREEEATNFGIFQEQGDPQIIQEYKQTYDAGVTPSLDQIGSHNVAGLLWMFFHELPEPLLTFALRDRWISAAAQANEGGHRAVQALGDCIAMLPPGARRALHALISLLATIHGYQNAATRLGSFFAEEILWSNTAPPNDVMAARVVELLILYYHDLFQGSPFAGLSASGPSLSAPPPAVSSQPSAPMFAAVAPPPAASPVDMTNDPFGYYEPEIVFKNYTRDEAESRLAVSPGGAYLVRPSSQLNCLSVSYKALDNGRVGHLLLSKPSAAVPGWTTDGRPKPYPTIRDLLRSLPYGLNLVDPVIK